MFELSPSLSAGSQLNLGAVLDATRSLAHIHLDVDDGNFVHEITFGMDTVRTVVENTPVPVDVHLEVLNPMDYVQPILEIGVPAACAHVEALPYPSEWLSALKVGGCPKRGLAINLVTPVDVLGYYADQLDYVLFVSVEADREGLPFRPMTLDKVRRARQILPDTVQLWVDGGVNETNLRDVVMAGADAVVMGRAVFGANNPVAAYERLVALGESYRRERDA
ncbi:MAG: ribulose-phosphate 3-epimerase [Coriobacteriales bacterium]|nr:ribulose-phosphate 3-epimerase [Coriobacteriales bacterium]MDO5708780.1 ribulose-phosphate 3-epimerase [Coriobacteriales bacterium]